jgi:SagB-type dehydrogenase family enzyme
LSFLLWASQGVQRIVPGKATFRSVPSAGARHPLETFVLVNGVQGIASGLYWFDALGHQVKEFLVSPEVTDAAVEACLDQDFVKTAGATFFWVAVAERTTWRYSERASATSFSMPVMPARTSTWRWKIHAGACAIAAFGDDKLNRLLRLDGTSVFAIYAAAVGRKPL